LLLKKHELEAVATCKAHNCVECLGTKGGMTDCTTRAAKTALAYRAMLKQIEWYGQHYQIPKCPLCHATRKDGHKEGCKLAELLKEV